VAVKVVFPVIFSFAAFVVAGVAAINGQFIAALVSGIGGVLSGLLCYYIGRRQVNKDWQRRLENVQTLSVEKLNGGMRVTFPDEDERRGNDGEGSSARELVEEDVRTVTDVLIVLVSGVVGSIGGYIGGVHRSLSESRNERRDAALAEIFKEMDLFHRYLGSWMNNPNPDPREPTAESVDIPARQHVRDQYNKFVLAFHGNAIWLGKDTYDLIQKFFAESMALLNELNHMKKASAGDWRLPDGTELKDRRKDQIIPKFEEVRDALRAEVEASRDPVAWFRYRRMKQRGLD